MSGTCSEVFTHLYMSKTLVPMDITTYQYCMWHLADKPICHRAHRQHCGDAAQHYLGSHKGATVRLHGHITWPCRRRNEWSHMQLTPGPGPPALARRAQRKQRGRAGQRKPGGRIVAVVRRHDGEAEQVAGRARQRQPLGRRIGLRCISRLSPNCMLWIYTRNKGIGSGRRAGGAWPAQTASAHFPSVEALPL